MDLQKRMDIMIEEMNIDFHKKNGTLSIGKLLEELKPYEDGETVYLSDFNLALDNGYCSYRGNYKDLALTHERCDGDSYFNVRMLKHLLNKALEVGSMEGYKGGEFPINKETYLYVSNEGIASGLTICYVEWTPVGLMLVLKDENEDVD